MKIVRISPKEVFDIDSNTKMFSLEVLDLATVEHAYLSEKAMKRRDDTINAAVKNEHEVFTYLYRSVIWNLRWLTLMRALSLPTPCSMGSWQF
jgi:hypothetical protein